MNINEIKALELVEIILMWLAYGGYNTFQGYRDKKLNTPPVEEEMPSDIPPIDDDGSNVTINF